MDRRDFLRLGLPGFAATLLGGRFPAAAQPAPVAVPRVNGGINVQPVRRLEPDAGLTEPLIEPDLVNAQMEALYELGFEQIRVTISFNRFGPDFLAAIPYVRASRALGIDVVGVMGQFTGFDLVQALSRPATRDEVLEVYARLFGDFVPEASEAVGRAGDFALQVLNEPTHFLGIPPDVYVREFLRPAYLHLKEDDPGLTVVSAATVGSAEGFLRARAMIEAGLELHCDKIAYHVYSRRFIPEIGALSRKPTWVTESGAPETSRHFQWWTEVFDEIRSGIPAVERIFWFDLFDRQPGRFRLIDLVPTLDGGFEPKAESAEVVSWLRQRVDEALEDAPRLSYQELVSDITLYFPTEEDRRLLESTSFGPAAWLF